MKISKNMPELPEVETVRTGLHTALKGATISYAKLMRPDLRFAFPAGLTNALESRKIEGITRRAKYLLWELDSDDILIAHLGMTGSFSVRGKPEMLLKHDHIELQLKDGRQVVYNDPRRFGIVTLAKKQLLASHALFAHLGPEPLEKSFTATYLRNALSTRKIAVKAAIMDQKLVVGVGNIYASEALFLSGVHPLRPANEAVESAPELTRNIRKVLRSAIASGGSSLRDFVDISGDTGYFQHHFKVYGKQKAPCEICFTPIQNVQIAGRSSFFCPSCQS